MVSFGNTHRSLTPPPAQGHPRTHAGRSLTGRSTTPTDAIGSPDHSVPVVLIFRTQIMIILALQSLPLNLGRLCVDRAYNRYNHYPPHHRHDRTHPHRPHHPDDHHPHRCKDSFDSKDCMSWWGGAGYAGCIGMVGGNDNYDCNDCGRMRWGCEGPARYAGCSGGASRWAWWGCEGPARYAQCDIMADCSGYHALPLRGWGGRDNAKYKYCSIWHGQRGGRGCTNGNAYAGREHGSD